MANTKLKKKKKGVIGANGLNNDAGRNDKQAGFGCYNLSRGTCEPNSDFFYVW